jgi:sugar phosphate isomerase/epimerase
MLDIASRLGGSVEVFYGIRGTAVCDMPLGEAARRIADAGYGVEVLISQAWDDRSLPTDETIEQLADVCRTTKFMTTHARINTWAPEVLRQEIIIAARIGVQQMVVHPYVLGFDVEDCSPPADEIRDLCGFARDSGVRLALENLGKTGITSMRRSLDIIGSDPENAGLGLCIDVGHAHRSCSNDGIRPEAFLAEFGDLIFEVHVDDNLGDKDLHLPPGQGTIDWPPVIEAMTKLRDDAVICLEIAWPADPMKALNESREFLLTTGFPQLMTKD